MPVVLSPDPPSSSPVVEEPSLGPLHALSEGCTLCGACAKQCAFLEKYGKPGEIARSFQPSDKNNQAMAFECSLCRLCTTVCPAGVDPAAALLEMRRETVNRGGGRYPEHNGPLAYERFGTSRRSTYYGLPEGCDTVFFPGCALPGTRPDKTTKLYDHMKTRISSLGLVLDCCTKISHDLGRLDHFHAMFGEMKSFLMENGVRNVIVACPNCHRIFKEYGGGLSVRTVYEFLVENPLPASNRASGVVAVHDPCALRFDTEVHAAVRKLARDQGLTVEETPHHGENGFCCGEGGMVAPLSPDLAETWRTRIAKEAAGRRLITYCAGCTSLLNRKTPTSHILDTLFEPDAAMEGKAKVSGFPMVYLNRLRLKKRLRKTIDARVTRERTFNPDGQEQKAGRTRRLALLVGVLAVILAVRFTGATRYLEQEVLRQWIQGYGALAPILYMLVYAVAPSLLLPGLPITLVGGILFGTLWGVVYTITSSTLGACLAFLVARYVARDWVEAKLTSPRWRRLDQGVEEHGWKVVAFTRLIPLFPFNLLNYAFGLTRINFLHYAVTTFFCMLPACVAFIVFSSSLLDVIRGQVSSAFLGGLGLIVVVSLIPVFYQRDKAKKGMSDPL